MLLGRKGSPDVPNGELNHVAFVRECRIVEREAPFVNAWTKTAVREDSVSLCLTQPAT